jgi:hypothetical protein
MATSQAVDSKDIAVDDAFYDADGQYIGPRHAVPIFGDPHRLYTPEPGEEKK